MSIDEANKLARRIQRLEEHILFTLEGARGGEEAYITWRDARQLAAELDEEFRDLCTDSEPRLIYLDYRVMAA